MNDSTPPTGLSRPMDLSYASNVAVLAASGIALALGLGRHNGLATSVSGAGWVFSTWALARELDHDEPASAVLASAVMVPVSALSPGGAVGGAMLTGALMTVCRAVAGTTGEPLQPVDKAVLNASVGGMMVGALIGRGGNARARVATLAALAVFAARQPGPPQTAADNRTPLDPRRVARARQLALGVATAAAVISPRAAIGLGVAAAAIALVPRPK